MLTGHRSHQIGLDADIWMYAPRRLTLSRADREAISSVNVVSGDGRTLNSNWTRAHYNIIRAAAEDPAVARIFVNPAIKLGMCNMTPERGEAARWLGKVRPWFGHNYHFHVRLACPAGSPGCVNQDPPPPHDDCATALTWFQPPDPNAPAAPSRPRRELTLADLPQQCASVLSSG